VDPQRDRDAEAFVSAGDDLWSGHDHSGWNRASIRFWSRSDPGAPVRPDDLLLPNGLGNARLLASCGGMGLIVTALYVWVPLMLVGFFTTIGGAIFVAVLASAFVTFTVGLYAWATIETQRDRELAGRL
jgi:hypothetical protein